MQDAYSLRCAAQVHGAARDALALRPRRRSTIEANAATDNPMVFADTGDIVSGGNFHGAPIAIAADLLAVGARPSSRRSASGAPIGWSNPALSGLPAFLTRDGGLQSGLMLAQVTAAALASELKTLAHPAGVDTIPTSANKEDHVSMSMTRRAQGRARASTRAREVRRDRNRCARARRSTCSRRSTTSPPLARVHALVRSRVPTLDDDRAPAPDIDGDRAN